MNAPQGKITHPYRPVPRSEARKAMLVAILQMKEVQTILQIAVAIPVGLGLVECAVYFDLA